MPMIVTPSSPHSRVTDAVPFFPCAMVGLLRFLFLFASCLILPAYPAGAAEPQRPQYVLISFDGAGPIEQWERSRALARQTGAEFTYFLSCVYLLTPDNKSLYKPPHAGAGRSNVGFAASREDVAHRLRQIWVARREGHEIASHGCGHFDGGKWTSADWRNEFEQFRTILGDAWSLNAIPLEPAGWREFAAREIEGFRAPYLSTGEGMFDALAKDGFTYDASGVSRGPAEPSGDRLLRFALPMIREGPKQRPVIAMDYNLFVRHSGGFERSDADGAFEQRTLAAFHTALDEQLAGDRIPLQLGFHFTLMNKATYWRALERFAADACTRPDIRCVSYRTYLEETRADNGDTTDG